MTFELSYENKSCSECPNDEYKGLFINYVIKIGGRGGDHKKIIIYYERLGGGEGGV